MNKPMVPPPVPDDKPHTAAPVDGFISLGEAAARVVAKLERLPWKRDRRD